MPNYDFKCRSCGGQFEENIPMSSTTTPACPKCGTKNSEKLFTGCQVASGSSAKGCGKSRFT